MPAAAPAAPAQTATQTKMLPHAHLAACVHDHRPEPADDIDRQVAAVQHQAPAAASMRVGANNTHGSPLADSKQVLQVHGCLCPHGTRNAREIAGTLQRRLLHSQPAAQYHNICICLFPLVQTEHCSAPAGCCTASRPLSTRPHAFKTTQTNVLFPHLYAELLPVERPCMLLPSYEAAAAPPSSSMLSSESYSSGLRLCGAFTAATSGAAGTMLLEKPSGGFAMTIVLLLLVFAGSAVVVVATAAAATALVLLLMPGADLAARLAALLLFLALAAAALALHSSASCRCATLAQQLLRDC